MDTVYYWTDNESRISAQVSTDLHNDCETMETMHVQKQVDGFHSRSLYGSVAIPEIIKTQK